MRYLYVVATKEVLVTVRIAEPVRDEFKIAAGLRGATMSGLIHQFIVRTIREEKEASPHEFRVHRIRRANAVINSTPRKRKTG